MRRLILNALVITLCLLSFSASATSAEEPKLADLLRHVPEDAALVIVVPNFSEVVIGIQAFGAAAGVQEISEIDEDTFWDEIDFGDLPSGWGTALRKNGPIVFALTETGSEPLLLATVHEPPQDEPTDLIFLKDKVLIVAPDSDVAAAINSSNGKFATRFLKQNQALLESKDVLVHFNLPAWSMEIHQILSMGEMMVQMGAASAPQESPMNLTLINWMFAKLRQLSEQSQVLTLAARIGADGVRLSKRVDFDQEGSIAGYLAKVKKPEKDLLRGLPLQPAMVIGGGEWQMPPDVPSLSEQILEVMMAELPQAEQDADKYVKMSEEMRRLYRAMSGYNGVMTHDPDSTGISVNGVYLTDQPREFFDGFSQLWEYSEQMMDSFMPGLKLDVTETTESIGSVKAKVYQMTFDATDEEMLKAISAVYGNPSTFYVAPHPEGVAYAFGKPDSAKKKVEQILKENGSPLAAERRITQALKKLSPKPQGFVLIDVPSMIAWGAKIAGTLGEAIPDIKPPTQPLPYMSMGIYMDKSAWSGELFFPAKVLKYIVSLSQEAPTSAPAEAEPY